MIEAVNSTVHDRVMMGMQGIRNKAWINEGKDDALSPVKQLSMTNENKPPNLRPIRKNIFANNFVTDHVDFDKLIVPETQQLKQKKRQKSEDNEAMSCVKPRSNENSMSFLESLGKSSPLFDSDIDVNVKTRKLGSLDDVEKDSAIASDNSLEDKVKVLKQEKEAEAKKELEMKIEKIVDLGPLKKSMIMSMKNRIKRYATSNFAERN